MPRVDLCCDLLRRLVGSCKSGNRALSDIVAPRDAALRLAWPRSYQKIGRIAREAVNRRDNDDIAVGESGHQFF